MVRIVDAKPETEVEYEANEVDAELESVLPFVGKSSAQPPVAPQVVRLTNCCHYAGRCAEGDNKEEARTKWTKNWIGDESGLKCVKYPCLTLVAKHGIDQCKIVGFEFKTVNNVKCVDGLCDDDSGIQCANDTYCNWLKDDAGESAFSQTVYYIQ